jgi:hypothetical protein
MLRNYLGRLSRYDLPIGSVVFPDSGKAEKAYFGISKE